MEVKFITPLDVEELPTKRWQLLKDFLADVVELGGVVMIHRVTVPAGFVTDFASVPRVPFAFMLCGDTAHKAAVLHDYLYSTGCDRGYADSVLRAAMAADGEPWWRRWAMWSAVRVFGGSRWEAAS